MIEQLKQLQRFGLVSSMGTYSLRETGIAEYSLYRIDGTERFIGYLTHFGYYFKITVLVADITFSKEIAYTEIIYKK